MSDDRRHVLAVRADSMGDVLVTGPAVRALAADAQVTVLAGPSGAAAARMLPGVERVVEFALPWIVADPGPCDGAAIAPLVRELRSLGPDEAVIFTSFHQSALPLALLLRVAGVTHIAAISDDYAGTLLDVRHRVDDDVHEVERALSLAAAAGHPLPEGDDRRLAVTHVRTPALPPGVVDVVVHPGASVTARSWDPDRCRALVRLLGRDGLRVAVTGGAPERALTAFVASGHPLAIDLGGACDLAQLTAVVAGASVIVCGNTGPAHLAAAVGTPVVSLFAPTVPAARWRPWMVPHVVLGDQDVECRGCRARVCPVAGHPCLDVPVAAVAAALQLVAPVLARGRAA